MNVPMIVLALGIIFLVVLLGGFVFLAWIDREIQNIDYDREHD